eukprot:4502555-Alexandrium_andersonii.AAC.1
MALELFPESFGFARGQASARSFYNAALGARYVVRGDDFAFAGYDADLGVAEKPIGEALTCKIEGRLGGGPK